MSGITLAVQIFEYCSFLKEIKQKFIFLRGAAEPFTFTMPPLARLVQLPRLERQHITLTLTLTLPNPNPAQPLSQELTFQRLL